MSKLLDCHGKLTLRFARAYPIQIGIDIDFSAVPPHNADSVPASKNQHPGGTANLVWRVGNVIDSGAARRESKARIKGEMLLDELAMHFRHRLTDEARQGLRKQTRWQEQKNEE